MTKLITSAEKNKATIDGVEITPLTAVVRRVENGPRRIVVGHRRHVVECRRGDLGHLVVFPGVDIHRGQVGDFAGIQHGGDQLALLGIKVCSRYGTQRPVRQLAILCDGVLTD